MLVELLELLAVLYVVGVAVAGLPLVGAWALKPDGCPTRREEIIEHLWMMVLWPKALWEALSEGSRRR